MSKGNIENLLKVPKLEAFLKDHIINNKELFLGSRRESIIVYYWCKSLLEIFYVDDSKCNIKINKKYVDNTALCGLKFAEKSDYMLFSLSDEFIKAFSGSYKVLKANVENTALKINPIPVKIENKKFRIKSGEVKIANKKPETKPVEVKVEILEKKFQEIIACNNNSNKDSDWYCVDLEYQSEGIPFGRIDMVIISNNRQHGKYQIAIIKLKYSWQAYKSGYRKNLYNDKKNKGYYIQAEILKTKKNAQDVQHQRRFGCKYDEKNKQIVDYEFGSGIVGNFHNYSRFLFADNGKYYNQLKEECYDVLQTKKKLGCFETNDHISEELLEILEGSKEEFIENISDVPQCAFLTVGCDDLEKCKQSMTSYLCAGPTNTADILSCTKDHWNLYFNDGKGKIKTIMQDLNLADCFPKAFDERIRYLFSKKEELENLNMIDHPDSSTDKELVLNIF